MASKDLKKTKQCTGVDAPECEQHLVHIQSVRQVQPKLMSLRKAESMAELLTLLGDSNRLRILSALSHRELCVCDVAALVGMTESAVSHQLRVLRNVGLVDFRKEGRNSYYLLAKGSLPNMYRRLAEVFG